MAPTEDTHAGWIGGRAFDGFFFFGSALAAAAVGALVVAAPSLVVPLWWLWLALGDGPHLAATWTRTYFDAVERKRRARLLATSLAWLLPGPLALAWSKWGHTRWPFDLFLLAATLWAYWHAVRQHYGILAIYARHAKAPRAAFLVDKWALYALLFGGYFVFLVGNPWARRVLELPPATPVERRALVGVAALLAAATLGYASYALVRVLRREAARPALFALASLFVVGFAMFAVGAFEPLYPRARDPEEYLLGVALVGGVSHSLQYLGIVGAANRRRFAGRDGALARLLASPWKSYALCAAFGLAYAALIAARGISPGIAWVPLGSDVGRLFLAIYWGLFFHHYWLDQYIWRPHRDTALRGELGIA